MSMTAAQLSAFENSAGFSPQVSAVFWVSLTLTLALLWCAWVVWMGYRGWAAGNVRLGSLGGSTIRVLVLLLILMFFTLS
ncbi:TIGR03758 family integrating conjugative element protein [Pseudomonas sp. LRF_L74]|uniref:TIGR03758 family integrating conjugative element protein n=1 Tax=Pseudomonas sp. LRF_L74 TaxID=3369422 RepID=UPI003F5F36E0